MAAHRVGLARDRAGAARRSIERWLDGEGAALFARSLVPGLAVFIRFADGRTIARNFGTAGSGRPVSEGTVFRLLSLSKPITAMTALSLVEDGVLGLDEPVWRRLRSWRLPAHRAGGFDVDGITLRRLLSHDAGLNVHGFGWVAAGVTIPAQNLLAREDDPASTLRLIAPPGTGLRYSGGGFSVVQLLVEEATGRAFADVARTRLLGPLGLEASGYECALAASPHLSFGHDADGRPMPRAELAGIAASGFVGTARDVATLWALALDGRGVLTPASRETMLTRHAVDERGSVCGLGFFVKERRADLKYMHLGLDAGWNLHAEGLTRRGAVVVLLSNGDRGRDCVPAFAWAIRERLYDGVV